MCCEAKQTKKKKKSSNKHEGAGKLNNNSTVTVMAHFNIIHFGKKQKLKERNRKAETKSFLCLHHLTKRIYHETNLTNT